MASAISAKASQLPLLLAGGGVATSRMSQTALLVLVTPPESRLTRVAQEPTLILSTQEGNVAARTSQAATLVLYRTGVPDPRRTRAWTFTLDGHTFYVLDLGTQGTFLYDEVTNQWCNFSTQGFEPQWNFINGTMWGNRIVAADMLTTDIWEMDPKAPLDEGWRDISHVVTGGLSTRNRVYIGCDALRVACSIGLLDELNGAVMRMRYSDDQEATWSDYFDVDLIVDDFTGEIAYRSLGSFMAPGRIFELSDSGGLIRIDGADAYLNGFDESTATEAEGGG